MTPPPKAVWRDRILESRRRVDPSDRRVENAALAAEAASLVRPGAVVCAYVPVGSEPGSVTLLDALVEAGATVLVPITRVDEPLSWARYLGENSLVAAGFGLREPSDGLLPPAAVADAEVVLVPALAVDRRGVRLGRGAGFYDRSLHLAPPSTKFVAVVRDDELVDELPEDPHDVRMHCALTPGRGLVHLGHSERAEQHTH